MSWREYHEATKHTTASLRQSRHALDWETMPEPFRHYEQVPVLDLPADPPPSEVPALDLLLGRPGQAQARDGATFLSQVLFYSAAISSSKRVPSTGYRYALRVNPSSGNLHPTEFHFLTRGVDSWPDGLYHYRPSSHMAEQRALGDLLPELAAGLSAPLTFMLTSIAWRESWKYQQRAYRYCLHDIGHAWQALHFAARALGCETFATGHFPDAGAAGFVHADEWPMLLVRIEGPSVPSKNPDPAAPVWLGGQANQLSPRSVAYPLIDRIHAATSLAAGSPAISAPEPPAAGSGEIRLPPPALSDRPFGEVARTRRSALDFEGGRRSMTLEQLSAILAAAAQPFRADFAAARLVDLYLYIHRVEDLEPGVYRYWPERRELERIKSGDQRVAAAGLSLRQELAGNACVAFSMVADLERAARAYGNRGYRYAHFEAGAIGQRLYLGAESFGLRGTGIGAFFDDDVHRYLDLDPSQGQVIYHFAIGHAIPDLRLEA